jgi:tRNA A-37 threonylcarbamoyl transferase component Bud32
MKSKGATAEIFLTAFKTLPKKEQDIFLSKILKDKRLREDLIDIAIAESRTKDRSRPFREFLKEHEN